MESVSWSSSHIYFNPISLRFQLSPSILSFPHCYTTSRQQRSSALKTTTSGYSAADLLKKPTVEVKDHVGVFEDKEGKTRGEKNWVDWEEQILEDTLPLVGFVRMILHSGKYENGERLSSEHENIIIPRLLAHHPEIEKKIGCGINYIMVGHHPDFESSRCLFVVRTNGDMVDFSYWKCIKGFIRKKYPLYADNFIVQHFRRHRLKD
ncbi:protein DCL homolog, chloroplastic-like [Cynara cardunculus var. scolymus]|uniref:Copper amine oxidase, N2/N3-terminal n=1 Tax=Cynara cardunculus var. scolymus TaxID=59895 RepID=A0A118JZM9_CYNCS|nr:protein DCL homolog, chloroplastic-like [Cynara cardunculus var. scolymus]KVH99429.1 Copper amine oxidase, N2/N3-terminal [Cynara cardunculus var. scolymus]